MLTRVVDTMSDFKLGEIIKFEGSLYMVTDIDKAGDLSRLYLLPVVQTEIIREIN
jgi:hypothetical protein